jgi:hemolysin activation/secretion protein
MFLNCKGIAILNIFVVLFGTTPHAIAQTPVPPTNVPPLLPEKIEPEPSVPTPAETPQPLLNIKPEQLPEPDECKSSGSDQTSFWVKDIQVQSNTVLHAEIEQIVTPLENRQVTFEDLLCLRSKISALYAQKGYVTSGAFLPNNQSLQDGIIKIQVVEGQIERIDINGLKHLRQSYVRDRLNLVIKAPLNIKHLQDALALLQLDPIIAKVEAELTPGSGSGLSILALRLKEARAFHLGFGIDNYRSASAGSIQGNVFVAHDNVLGFGDRIRVEYGRTEGLNTVNASYSIPFNPLNGTIDLSYNRGDSNIVQQPFQRFDISSESETFSLNVRQPVLRTPSQELAIGISFDISRKQTFLLGEPFPFSIGDDDRGRSRTTVLRLYQEWLAQGRTRVLAARSQFSFGIDALGATINDTGTDGRFFAWQGQFQWVQQMPLRSLLFARVGAQLTPDSLLSLEQFSLGGISTVRGYGQNQLVTDNALLASLEARIPLLRDPKVLQLTPFVDFGMGWNNQAPDPDRSTLVGIGLGLRYTVNNELNFRLDYGIPLIPIANRGNSLQEQGFYFSINYQPF